MHISSLHQFFMNIVENSIDELRRLGRAVTFGQFDGLVNRDRTGNVGEQQFVRPETGSVSGQILLLATVLNLIGLVVNGLVILTASRIGAALSRRTRFQRAPQILLGTVFAGLAARLAFGGQR